MKLSGATIGISFGPNADSSKLSVELLRDDVERTTEISGEDDDDAMAVVVDGAVVVGSDGQRSGARNPAVKREPRGR